MNFFFGKNRLRRAMEQGFANGKLDDELKELGDLTIKSRADAEAICWGLQQVRKEPAVKLGKATYALAGLFQEVKSRDCDAFEILQERGIPQLLELFDEIHQASSDDDVSTLMFILKMLARYGTTAGTLKIVEAARLPLKPDGYIWSVIFRSFTPNHPETELFYRSLSNPLPPDFIGVSLLDAANACQIAGGEITHPFDSPEGWQRLQVWLTSPNEEKYSYAQSATAALPFISNPHRDELLDLALKHPDVGVQIEAAWAAAKLGREDGFQHLAGYCLDFNHSGAARRYLGELKREDLVPAAAKEPNFAALSQFAHWLAHPNELGRAPDTLEIVDQRELAWPPERKRKPFWLIKYRMKDATGLAEDDEECGLVGSMTFCFFSYKLAQRPPEDAYAVHCYWEMEHAKLIEELDVQENPDEYQSLLKQWRGGALEQPRMLYVAELSPDLRPAQRLVALASARLEGADGWVVFDGDRSAWYPRAEMPEAFASVALKIHVGRQLLGFTDKPDRKKYLLPPLVPHPPEQIIAAYLKCLAQAEQKEGKSKKRAFGLTGPLSKHFDAYVETLIQTGRGAEIIETIRRVAPNRDHCGGYLSLGAAAFKCGQFAVAEDFLLQARQKCAEWERCEEMELLAEIWRRAGRAAEAKTLLIECLQKLLAESKTAPGEDKPQFEKWFQNQRAAYFRLFPAEAAAALLAQAIPDSTLNR